LAAKEKTVRYRSTQIISHIVNSLDSIDDEYYHLVRVNLLKRIRDRESMVRVQAVLGLGRLAGNEGDEDHGQEDSDSDESSGLLEKLLDVLQNDPSGEVRRSLLLNLPLTPTTLPFLLERARDLDPATRRALYSRLLPALGDFRHLSLSMREKLLRWGLRDRDENVRKATARLFRERWIEDCVGTSTATESSGSTGVSAPSMEALLELLERIDVINSGVSSGIALEALKEFWRGRPDYQDAISFDDAFWDNLSAESVFLARSLNDFCRQEGDGKYEALIEEKMPEVTKLGFFIQRYANDLVARLRQINTIAEEEGEEDTVEQEFIVEQLLHIAQILDYSDEVGRRKMFALLREALAVAELPDEITKLIVEVLRTVSGNDSAAEREFCGVVLEAVAEVHDTIVVDETAIADDDESFHSARSELTDTTPTQDKKSKNLLAENEEADEEKAIREIMVNMKCLHIAQCMLQNVGDNLQDNVHLVTMLNNLVVPAVRSHEAPIRERGLLCLGLCCLLDKVDFPCTHQRGILIYLCQTLAEENLTLFLHCFSKGHDALQVTALHVLSDIFTSHPTLISQSPDPALQKSIFKVFSKGLKATQAPDVQSAATTALCKLMLTNIVTEEDLLKQLVICYFEPATKENAAMRQALSYFLPVYCHSRRENMERMANVVPGVIHAIVGLGEELDDDEEMVGVGVVVNMLTEWTDARKLVVQDAAAVSWDEAGRKEIRAVNGDIHLDMAESMLERVMSHGCPSKCLLSADRAGIWTKRSLTS
jgi:condensin complex subunit 3